MLRLSAKPQAGKRTNERERETRRGDNMPARDGGLKKSLRKTQPTCEQMRNADDEDDPSREVGTSHTCDGRERRHNACDNPKGAIELIVLPKKI